MANREASLQRAENEEFQSLLKDISSMSYERHSDALVEHALANSRLIEKTIRDLPILEGEKARSAIILSAGPSLHRQKSIQQVKDSGYEGTLIAVDGCLITCLKAGLKPDFVLTLDPHKTRIVRWFGDPDIEKNQLNDDYFARQDLDVNFRSNMIEQNRLNIELINQRGCELKAVVATSAPVNVVNRLVEADFDRYWWNPLVDNPREQTSLTRKLYEISPIPCMNTGGNVGTASWVFATTVLKIPMVGLLGMDLGYYHDLPYDKTQNYYELIAHVGRIDELDPYFPEYTFPLTGEVFYSDPTYSWYRRNLLELMELSRSKTVNCTGGGTLFSDSLECWHLKDFIEATQS